MESVEEFGGTGRRKRAVARVKIQLGQGVITVNRRPLDEYFPRPSLQQIARQALEVTKTGTRFDVTKYQRYVHRTWIKGFDVHDDGPDEKMMRAMLAPHTVSETARVEACKTANAHTYIGEIAVGEGPTAGTMKVPPQCPKCGHHEGAETIDVPNIDPSEVEAHVKAYLQPATAKDHIAHLSKHFKVKAVSP